MIANGFEQIEDFVEAFDNDTIHIEGVTADDLETINGLINENVEFVEEDEDFKSVSSPRINAFPPNVEPIGIPLPPIPIPETSKKDNHTGLKVAGGLVAATAAAIIGLGYLHKSGKLSKVTNEKLKTCIETLKIEDAAKKCHELCGSVKTKVTELVNSFKK